MTDWIECTIAACTLRCALIRLECGNTDGAIRDIRAALKMLDDNNAKRNAAIFAM